MSTQSRTVGRVATADGSRGFQLTDDVPSAFASRVATTENASAVAEHAAHGARTKKECGADVFRGLEPTTTVLTSLRDEHRLSVRKPGRVTVTAIVIALVSCGTSAAAEKAAAEKDEPLPTFAETCFQTRPFGSFLPLADAQRMLEGIGGESRVSPADRASVKLKGLFRLRDWTPESTVCFNLREQASNFRIYVWGDGHGVAIYALPNISAAYRIAQAPHEHIAKDPLAVFSTLVATDDRRGFRLPPGAWQIRCQEGAVVLTKGSVRVMTVPLESPAKALYLEVPWDMVLQDLALLHSGPAPEEIAPAHRVVLDGKQPSALPWKETLPKGARLQKLPDGCVELAVENTAEPAMATVAVARPGLYEVIAQVDDATPGTGIALLNAKGEAADGIEFARVGKTSLGFGFGNPKEQPSVNVDFSSRSVPLAGPRQWLRLVVAGGWSRCWVSADGVHWGSVLDGRDRSSSWQTIALYAREASDPKTPDNAARHIRLRSLQVRELSGLTTAAAADLLAKTAAANVAMKVDQGESPPAWTQRIAMLAPKGSSPAAWRYACTLQALAAPLQSPYAELLLHRAVRERLQELRSTPAKIDLLQDAALVSRAGWDVTQRQFDVWNRLGREILNAGDRADFERYQQAIMQTSFAEPTERGGPISWELVRDAMLLFYVDHREVSLTRMEKLVAFWRANAADGQVGGWPIAPQIERLLQAFNVRPLKRGQRNGRRVAIDITRSVTPPLNRAATNILSELVSALEGKQYADAARSLISSAPPHDEGLVPAPDDDQLFVSFRVALRLLMARHPGFAEAMDRQVGPADQLRIEQVLARGDAAAVEALPLQYCGAAAATVPCQWLGDRALAAVDLAQAVSWYDEGLRWASPAQQPDLAARKRLAMAMLGTAQGRPPTQPVTLGSVKVPPEQFEGWIREQLARRRLTAEVASAADALPVVGVAQPAHYQMAPVGQLNDSEGRAFKGNDRQGEFKEIDWSWRSLTLQASEDSLLAAERSRITAFDLAGKLRWDVRLRNGWASSPVRPLVCGPRIYIRAATASNRPGIACLDGKTGRVIWLGECGGAASDPLWYRGRLLVLTIGPAGGQFVSPLCLVELHPETGDVLSRQQILETAERENLPGECQVSWAGNRLIVLVAGSVICADLQGRTLWVRQETALPYDTDPAFVLQHCQPAIEADGRLFVQQPGSCAIDCLALETGQRNWRRGLIGLQRLVDLPDDRLLARTARGLVGLNKATGDVLWQREFPGLLSATARTRSGLILCVRQALEEKPQLVFFWIDPATGQTRAHGLLPLEKNQPIFFGPIAARGDRTWCCLGYGPQGESNPKQIMELRPGKPAEAGEAP